MVRLHSAPCSSLDGVTACVVYTADSIQKFDLKLNRTADSIRDSIRTQKKTIRRSLGQHCTAAYIQRDHIPGIFGVVRHFCGQIRNQNRIVRISRISGHVEPEMDIRYIPSG